MITWFHKASFEECAEALVNPDRGWYQIFPFMVGEFFSEEVIRSCLLKEERIVLVLFHIGRYANGELPQEALLQMKEILAFFVREEKDIVLRVSYDTEGRAMEREPSLFKQVSRHMEQVAALSGEFGERIFVYQGLLIGNWGEMHGSRYIEEKYLVSLADTAQEIMQGRVYRAVRTPAQRQILLQSVQAKEEAIRMVGVFDDAILGSITDVGTYSVEKGIREAQIEQMCQTGLRVPCGGEAVWGEGYVEELSPEKILQYLARIRVTYLNRQHDRRILEYWKTVPCGQKGAFAGSSLYDYIGAHLGYRFVVRGVRVKVKKGVKGCRLEISIRIENVGFAPIYRHTESFILWQDRQGRTETVQIPMDLCGVSSVYEKTVSVEIDTEHPAGLSLLTRRAFDGALIRFANGQTEDGSVRLGEW
ncbi:MAG: DUF4832 domain-containing protein [Lachnospiraceae bacterium]|nr:DUF4832 domain-containing protein [Lachnospiraceae bacterium]